MAFRLPTRTRIGPGVLSQLGECVGAMAPGTVVLVTDRALQGTPWPDRARLLLSKAGRSVLTVDEVEPNPRTGTVDRLAQSARDAGAVAVVALGGGSVLDAAKGVALLLTNPGGSADYEGKNRFKTPAAPLVAIPTTCGTGSEVTWVSVLSRPDESRKISVKGDGLFPTWALVDADLLKTLPSTLVAQTGMDAMTHAIEAYLANVANPVSDALAEKAVSLLLKNLIATVSDTTGNPSAREAVMRGSTLAGMAFGNADVGAVHCLSESIGGVYDHPHGLVNAMLLTPVLRGHGEAATSRLAELARHVGASDDPDDTAATERFLSRLEGLGTTCGIPPFSSLGLPESGFDRIATLAEGNGSNDSNPKIWTAADYRGVLDSVQAAA